MDEHRERERDRERARESDGGGGEGAGEIDKGGREGWMGREDKERDG